MMIQLKLRFNNNDFIKHLKHQNFKSNIKNFELQKIHKL